MAELEIRPHADGDGYYVAKKGKYNPMMSGHKPTTRLTKKQALKTRKFLQEQFKRAQEKAIN